MPSSSSFCAMTSLSSTENETDSPCVPSRSVVSKVKIFILLFGGQSRLLLRHSYFLLLFQEGHHLAKLAANLLDRLLARGIAHGQKLLAAGLVLLNPLPGELTLLDFGQDLAHFGARLLVDDARPAGIVAIFGGVRYGITH